MHLHWPFALVSKLSPKGVLGGKLGEDFSRANSQGSLRLGLSQQSSVQGLLTAGKGRAVLLCL